MFLYISLWQVYITKKSSMQIANLLISCSKTLAKWLKKFCIFPELHFLCIYHQNHLAKIHLKYPFNKKPIIYKKTEISLAKKAMVFYAQNMLAASFPYPV